MKLATCPLVFKFVTKETSVLLLPVSEGGLTNMVSCVALSYVFYPFSVAEARLSGVGVDFRLYLSVVVFCCCLES